MASPSYIERREALTTYFDRTAIEAWKAFATDAPVSRIRQTVRAGRTRMRALMLAQLPHDLSGWHVFDAGCGTGAMTFELARRGARVTAVDLSPESIRFAQDNWPADAPRGNVTFASGDMLDPSLGDFDAVVAMDSIIHYAPSDAVDALRRLGERTRRRIVFTHAPATRTLRTMHSVGKLFPRSDRSPAIVPTEHGWLREALQDAMHECGNWAMGASRVVSSGFYTSRMAVLHSRWDGHR